MKNSIKIQNTSEERRKKTQKMNSVQFARAKNHREIQYVEQYAIIPLNFTILRPFIHPTV